MLEILQNCLGNPPKFSWKSSKILLKILQNLGNPTKVEFTCVEVDFKKCLEILKVKFTRPTVIKVSKILQNGSSSRFKALAILRYFKLILRSLSVLQTYLKLHSLGLTIGKTNVFSHIYNHPESNTRTFISPESIQDWPVVTSCGAFYTKRWRKGK